MFAQNVLHPPGRHKMSRRMQWVATAGIAAVTASISFAAVLWAYHAGWLLYYGDAESHLNHARRVFDSHTPGAEQLGTVWLPLPHLLMLRSLRTTHSGVRGLQALFPLQPAL